MIVTRQRVKRRSYGRLALPVIAVLALVVAVAWPPSRNAIVNGPLRPAFGVLGAVAGGIARPFTFIAQQEQITEKNREIAKRSAQVEDARRKADESDAKAKALQAQVAALQAQPVPVTPPPVARATASPSAMALGSASGTGSASDEIKRDAQVWANMEPEKAAALVRKLPDDQVAAVFAQMSPDAVGPIMEALPADVAARITQTQGVRTVR